MSMRKVFVFGWMGTGKSTLINYLIGSASAEAALSATSVTKNVSEHQDLKTLTLSGVDASEFDVEYYNRTGQGGVHFASFEFVEFPGFGETTVVDELRNNVELLDYISKDLVHGFIFCSQINNRLNNHVVSYLKYLQDLCGPEFAQKCLFVLTSLTKDMFEDDFSLNGADLDAPYSIKFDEQKFEDFRDQYARELAKHGCMIRSEHVLMINARMRERDATMYSQFFAARDSDRGSELFLQNVTFYSLEMRRRIIQYFRQVQNVVTIDANACKFSSNINAVLDKIELSKLTQLQKIVGDTQTSLIEKKIHLESQQENLKSRIFVRVDHHTAAAGMLASVFGGDKNKTHRFVVKNFPVRRGVTLEIVSTLNAINVKHEKEINDDTERFIVSFEIEDGKKDAVIHYRLWIEGKLQNADKLAVVTSELVRLYKKLKPVSKDIKKLESELAILKTRSFRDAAKLAHLIEQYNVEIETETNEEDDNDDEDDNASSSRSKRSSRSKSKKKSSSPRNKSKECCVCLDLPPNAVLVPCGHMFCEGCASNFEICPMCDVAVIQFVKTFIP